MTEPLDSPGGAGPVAAYIAAAPEPARGRLAHFHARAVALAPTAEEGTSYGMPALRYRGRPLISVITTKAGYSAFPFSPEVVTAALPLAAGLKATKGGVTFTEEKMLSDEAFDALVCGRVAEIDAALGGR